MLPTKNYDFQAKWNAPLVLLGSFPECYFLSLGSLNEIEFYVLDTFFLNVMWFVDPYVAGKVHQNLNLRGLCLEGTQFAFQIFFLSQKFLPTSVSDSLFKNKPVWHNLRECVSSFPVRAPVCTGYINKYKQLSESSFNTGSGFGPEFLTALITNIKTGNEEGKKRRALRAPRLSWWKTQKLGFTFHMFSSVYLQRSLWKINK